MKRLLLAAVACLLLGTGCSMRDLLWSVLGNSYNGGGPAGPERRAHYDQQYDSWEAATGHPDPTQDR